MSMSTLGNQLAALSSSSKSTSAGIVPTGTSRDTNIESIGRGFHHSNKHGHSILDNNENVNVKNRPSILFDNGREAAEVSLLTLRENAMSALLSLSEVPTTSSTLWKDPEFINTNNGLLSLYNCNNFERGTTTFQDNITIDTSIEKLLKLLMTMVTECPPPSSSENENDINSNPILVSCLHIIEYLVRKYEIHTRPTTSRMLLQVFLPLQITHTTAYPMIFSRVLSLIDLTTISEYAFLRPYASLGSPPLNRNLLAKHVAKNDALVNVIGKISVWGNEICIAENRRSEDTDMLIDRVGAEEDTTIQGGGALLVRRGISTLLSFSASILVEAIHIQSISRDNSINSATGGVQESLVRVLIPLVLSACKSSGGGNKDVGYCPEWKEWGRLLASTISMKCPLSDDAKVAFCDAIVEGLPTVDVDKGRKKKSFQDAIQDLTSSDDNALSVKEADDAGSAIMTLLSILGTMASSANDEDDDDKGLEYYLPMLPPKKKRMNTTIIDYLGCELPSSTYKRLSKEYGTSVAKYLGAILQGIKDEDDSDDEEEVIENSIINERLAPLVASIIMQAFTRLEKEAGKVLSASVSPKKRKSKSKGGDREDGALKCKADRDVLLILSLIQEPSLTSLWGSKHSALVAAVTVHTMTSYDRLHKNLPKPADPKSSALILQRYSSILKALSVTNSVVYDQGVAYAINTLAKSDKNDNTHLSRFAQLLGREDISSLLTGSKSRSRKGKGTNEDNENVAASLLPPRVALENADASVRLDAISRLRVSIENGDEDADEGLGQALLRRLVIDDDAAVATAAGEIVASQLTHMVDSNSKSNAFSSLIDDLVSLAEEVLSALLHWTFIGNKDDLWSPISSSDNSKKKKKGKAKSKQTNVDSPLLSCISICGSVAKLILEEESLESMNMEDDDDSMTSLLCKIFVSLGAHINIGSFSTEDASKALHEAVSVEVSDTLLQVFNNDDDKHTTVTDLVTKHSGCQKLLTRFLDSQQEKESSPLQSRFVWFVLQSYSNILHEKTEPSPVILEVSSKLALCQMKSYNTESKNSSSFQWEVDFLCDLCKKYLSLLSSGGRDGFEKGIMKLASTSSTLSFDEIVKPAIAPQFSQKENKGHGLAVLLNSCLQPHATKDGTLRLLANASTGEKRMNSNVARECIVPTLALLSHPDRSIRENMIRLLERFQTVKKDEVISDICAKATDKKSPTRSSLLMDGANTLSTLLGQVVITSGSSADVQKFLIESCKSCALTEDGNFSNGGCQASAVLLSALEKAGENVFPLSKRWEFAGHDLFKAFLECKVVMPSLSRLRDCVLSMLKGVLVNEAQGDGDGMSLQISVGPSHTGRRTRSYSIGASSSFTTLDPYPTNMLQAILDSLRASSTSSLQLPKHVIQLIISRESWTNGVFLKLNIKSRVSVATALLTLRTRDNDEHAGQALLGLPLKSSDFMHLLKEVDASRSEIDLSSLICITDCIYGRLEVLGSTSDITKLSNSLFDQLLSISSVKNVGGGDSGGRDYTRVALLQTLLAIHSHYKSELSKPDKDNTPKRKRSRSHSDVGVSSKTLSSQADLLVGLVGGNTSVINPLDSGRGRALSLSLLTCLCEESPSAVVSSLLPALMGLASGDEDNQNIDMNALGDALVAIVPAYCTHASTANLSLFSLLESFVGKVIVSDESRYVLLDHLVDALKMLPTKESSSDAIASLSACVMAFQAFNIVQDPNNEDYDSEMEDDENDFNSRLDNRVLTNTSSAVKIAVSLSLLQYAQKLMAYICDISSMSEEDESPSSDQMKVNTLQIITLALNCSNNEDERANQVAYSELNETQKRSILYLANNLLQSVRDVLSTSMARRVIRKSKGDDADLCLRLWNELMLTHTNTLRAHSKLASGSTMSPMEKKFWAAAPIATDDCLDNLQSFLPVSHFLASVSSALTDEDVDTYISKKSMKLLSDRVAELSTDSPEASLFLEMVPDLVAQLNIDAMDTDSDESLSNIRRTIVMQQGSLIAIESFARYLYPTTENGKLAANAASVFLPALASVTKLLDSAAKAWIKANESSDDAKVQLSGVADAECQLLSSSSLCLSTLIAAMKARCLPQLPSIIKPLVTSLTSVNVQLEGSKDNEASSPSGELLQLSILKTLHAIADALPQFLLPYLPLLFYNHALPSSSLRRGAPSVRTAVVQVETALSSKVQIRQLIPALSQALSKILKTEGSENWQEACSIMNVMNIAVESSQRSDLSPIISKIVNGVLLMYGYEGDDDDSSRPQMLQSANKCLLSLVMKLSEAQLRPLYARLREWRGDIEDKEAVSSIRRYAFWSLSAELSRNLRSIFLPCLTSVITDVIDELEFAVSLLCRGTKKSSDGSKRRRVDETNMSDEDLDKVKPLQPLLLCLEYALKADAHEGGDWTRGDDNQRYNMILNHLGKLLLAQVPKDISIISDLTSKEQSSTSAYQQLVQGVGTLEYGNVVGCVTSLAAAAGNEQLWKPLNFAVLEACGHKRSEVRKAGISCLLSIIETVGEEYMVLLPECLPVLSELLEDDDEIAGIAKECIQQGEDLLGESLSSSL